MTLIIWNMENLKMIKIELDEREARAIMEAVKICFDDAMGQANLIEGLFGDTGPQWKKYINSALLFKACEIKIENAINKE